MPKIKALNNSFNILVIDSAGAFRSQMTLMLSKYDYNAIHATSGMHALQITEEQAIDFIILSKDIPDLSALETAALLRAETLEAKSLTSTQVPIIILTQKYSDEEFAAYTDLGVDRYILKNQGNIATIPTMIKEMLTPGK